MVKDVRRRAPYYWSDWVDAWDYRVVPATVYMFFAKYVHITTATATYCLGLNWTGLDWTGLLRTGK